MALDATVGGASSNSYVTLFEADEYFFDRAHAGDWDNVDDQESLLVTASLTLDWYVTWKGTRAVETQSMQWPRSDVYDDRGELYAEDVIPQKVKTAVFELALSSTEADRTADGDLAGLSKVKAGSLEIVTDDGVYNTLPDTIPDKIWKILSGLTTKSGSSVVRLIRA